MQYTRQALQDIDKWYGSIPNIAKHYADSGKLPMHDYNKLIGSLRSFTPKLREIQQHMRISHKFLFPHNFYNHVKSFESVIPLIRMPFKSITLEFEADMSDVMEDDEIFQLSSEKRYIVQLVETPSGVDIYSAYIHDEVDDRENDITAPKQWLLIESVAHYEYGTDISDLTVTPFDFGNEWEKCTYTIAKGTSLECSDPENSFPAYQTYLRYLAEKALIGLAFLNLRNSETINIPMTPMQRSRSINKPYPYFSYNICSIFAGLEVIQAKPSERTKLAENLFKRNDSRLHMVRGHFKRRKTGIYWWSSFLRGSEQLGLVAKDYQVK